MPANKWEKKQAEIKAQQVKAIFDRFVPDEETAVDFLFRELQWRGLVKCRGCLSREVRRRSGERDMVCLGCKKIDWFTADGFFDHAKDIKAWLLLFTLLLKRITVSGFAFSRLAGIASATAYEMYKRVDMAILEFMPDDSPTISSSAFLSVIFKRSLLTPARQPPSAEEAEMDQAEMDEDIDQAAKDLAPEMKAVFDSLSDKPIQFDNLLEKVNLATQELSYRLVTLQMKGLVECDWGDVWKRAKRRTHSTQQIAGALCERFINFVHTYFHGISRKYLQPYLARFWLSRDRASWNASTILNACLRKQAIERHHLLEYVTPRLVSVVESTPEPIRVSS